MMDYAQYCEAVQSFVCVPSPSLTSVQVDAFIERVGIGALLAVLAAKPQPDQEHIREDTIVALERVLSDASGRQAFLSMENVQFVVQQGLTHAEDIVQSATLKILRKLIHKSHEQAAAENLQPLIELISFEVVMSPLIDLLSHESSSLAEESANVLVEFCGCGRSCVEVMFSGPYVAKLKQVIAEDSSRIFSVRCLSLCTRIASLSEHSFQLYESSSFAAQTMNMLEQNSGDILLQMTSFELVTEIGQSLSGMKFLSDYPFTKVFALFAAGKSDDYLASAALKALTSIMDSAIKFNVLDWTSHDSLMEVVTSAMCSEDETIKEAAIGTVCSFSRCEVGLRTFEKVLYQIPSLIPRSDISLALKIASLHGLATTIEAGHETLPDSLSIEQMHKNIFEHALVDQDEGSTLRFIDTLRLLLANPEQVLRIAVYRLLSELAQTTFGGFAILDSPLLVQKLLDRHSETESLLCKWQFTVVQMLSRNQCIQGVHISVEQRKTIMEFVHQGPLYRPRETQVLTE